MTGWLIVNEFLTAKKYTEINDWLCRAAQKEGIRLQCFTNAEAMRIITPGAAPYANAADFVLFWDKDIHLARLMEQSGLRLFNTADAVEKCDDKALTHIALSRTGLPMPPTYLVPKAYPGTVWRQCAYLDAAAEALGFPLVVKECFGSFGRQVYLAQSYEAMLDIMNRVGAAPMLLQRFIPTSAGRDIRLHIVGGRPVACMLRTAQDDDFRANVTAGATMLPHTPTPRQVEIAQQACHTLGLDFAGVDILFGENDEPILCEVNSNAHFVNIFNCTGVNVAEAILCHIKKEMYG